MQRLARDHSAWLRTLGEYHKEIQTLDYDYHISKEDESGQSELVNQEAGELDMSGTTLEPNSNDHPKAEEVIKEGRDGTIEPSEQFGSEDAFIEIPNQSLSAQKNETWELVECPPGKKPIGCRWIYTVKYKADGSIERFKVRLVAKGYTQTYGIDYTETFAPVAIVRVLLSLAANPDWPLQQFDVKNVFLHGELSEEVYMDLPPGCMVSKKQCQKVCKLKKSLYGLKQSLRAWFGRFTKSMRAFGYRQSNSNHTLFLKKQHGKITTLIVYVDDMVVTGNNPEERKTLQNYLSREFEMKDLGPLKYFLGIEVSRSSEGIFLSKRKYALDLLQETEMLGCQPINTPIEEVSQYMYNSGEQHMNAVMRILRYLKNAPGKGILFTKNVDHQSIEVCTDVDWVGVVDDRRSTSGYFSFVGGNLVTWKSKKQNVVARSVQKWNLEAWL
ncbi:Retrovirus-related Pol polyprotein from transposon RE1 [Vitis vinifera]|uniref:Retrovirus-related Pol polyprotein from transposon RE1 n=1 Tax=Vitis vinifera TaxID=29760 RepID=A0A438DP67_VITVI|nr:Retrovirus-related Pol polyprotein from transposon RE1 [Vitis vinifera]